MTDARITNLARILVNYSTKVQPGDVVAIGGRRFVPAAIPLCREVYREVLRAGGHPYTYLPMESLEYVLYSEANDEQLQHVDPMLDLIAREFDCSIVIIGADNTRYLSATDPTRQTMWRKAHTEVFELRRQRTAAGEFRWVLTMFPTSAFAQDAGMSLEQFEDFVYGAAFADAEDPVAEWEAVHDSQQRLVDWLSGKKQVEVKGPDVDLRLSIDGRAFINSDGTHNIPSGEVFTGPVEESVNGWVRFTFPAVLLGNLVDGVELHFEQGKVVKATAKENQEFLLAMLETDAGARYLGEFAIGTNKRIDRFIKNILFDEKIGGTIHLALGAGYPQTGSKNKSAIHWDMICDMREGGQILVDGEVFYDSGEFVV